MLLFLLVDYHVFFDIAPILYFIGIALLLYLLVFGPSYLCAFAYWLRGQVGFGRAIVLAHAFELYSNLWLIAGWMAVFRIVFRKRGWEKTARVAETEVVVSAAK